jgi:hypothetical protein
MRMVAMFVHCIFQAFVGCWFLPRLQPLQLCRVSQRASLRYYLYMNSLFASKMITLYPGRLEAQLTYYCVFNRDSLPMFTLKRAFTSILLHTRSGPSELEFSTCPL